MNKKKPLEEITIHSSAAEYLIFVTATNGSLQSIKMWYQEENIWLTPKTTEELYNVFVSAINQYLKMIFDIPIFKGKLAIKYCFITANYGESYNTWTDEKMYQKYSITKDEQAFIESIIRPMETPE